MWCRITWFLRRRQFLVTYQCLLMHSTTIESMERVFSLSCLYPSYLVFDLSARCPFLFSSVLSSPFSVSTLESLLQVLTMDLSKYVTVWIFYIYFFDHDATVCYIITTTTTVLQPFFRDYPGEPVPEETFNHPHLSWSSTILCQLSLSTTYTVLHFCLFTVSVTSLVTNCTWLCFMKYVHELL